MPQDSFVPYTTHHDQLSAIKANDERVLKVLYQENYPKIEAYILNNNGSQDQAKDIYQEAFIAVWRNIQLDRFRPENETSLGGYIYRIAKNKWLDYLRSSHHTKLVRVDEDRMREMDYEDVKEGEHEYLGAVKSSFEQIGANCKELLTRFYYKKESMKQIADAFGWTDASARNNKYRCVEKIRALLKK